MYSDADLEEPIVNSYPPMHNTNNHLNKPSKLGYVLISTLVLIPIALGVGVCSYYANKQKNDINADGEDDDITKILVWLKIVNLTNIKFNTIALIMSFGVVFPSMIFGAIYAVILEKLLANKKDYISVNEKPRLSDFFGVSIIPVGILLYASLIELVHETHPPSLIILLISITWILIIVMLLIIKSIIMIMVTFPFRFWQLVLYGAQ